MHGSTLQRKIEENYSTMEELFEWILQKAINATTKNLFIYFYNFWLSIRMMIWLNTVPLTDCYILPSKPKVIIMYTTEGREGCEEERQSIEESLNSWSTVESQVLKDPTRVEFEDAIREANTCSQGAPMSALIIIIMSHGRAGHFNVKGESVNIQNFLDYTVHTSKSADVPKVSIQFHNCRDT